MEVALTPASEQLIQTRGLQYLPASISLHVAQALFEQERQNIAADIKRGREVLPERLQALDALFRETGTERKVCLIKAVDWNPCGGFKIVNGRLCYGHLMADGRLMWVDAFEHDPVVIDDPDRYVLNGRVQLVQLAEDPPAVHGELTQQVAGNN